MAVVAFLAIVIAVTFSIPIGAIGDISAVIILITFGFIQQHTMHGDIYCRSHRPFCALITTFSLGMSSLYFTSDQYNGINDTSFFETGRWIVFRQGYRRMLKRKFKAHFGASPEICCDIWQMINPCEEMNSYTRPMHLLWGCMLMKVYATEEVLSAIAGVTEKTFRKWAWDFFK